jgi:hypothetical protein
MGNQGVGWTVVLGTLVFMGFITLIVWLASRKK